MWPSTPGKNKYRRIVPNPGMQGTWQQKRLYPSTPPAGYTPTILWADGSVMDFSSVPAGTYTWPDHTTGHAVPKDNTQNFGLSALGFFMWGVNLFPDFQNDVGLYVGVTTLSGTLDLLDKNGAQLARASWNSMYDQDDSGNYATEQALVLPPTDAPASFNAIRAAVSGSFPGGQPPSLVVTLFWFLANPVEI